MNSTAPLSSLDRFLSSFFNAEVAARYVAPMIDGMLLTMGLGLCVIATGLVLGLGLAVLRIQHVKLINGFIIAFADIFRALPPLVVIILLFFAFPYIELSMSAFTATWLALSLVLAAFTEEIFWAGMLAIPKGQWEAARSTGLSFLQALGYVVLPQALRLTIPPLTNRTIAITKGTALASVVAVPDILGAASSGLSHSFNPSPLTLGALAYLVLFFPVVLLGRWIETRFAWKR